ncbi:MAG: c-type cytochrome [Planctomycetaceae bacterium]|nr:c-type cytochrome [Planctomycetaceae bacterium]
MSKLFLCLLTVVVPLLTCCSSATFAQKQTAGKPIYNSQKEGENPSSPLEAANAITVPEGFRVTLFAGEPDVSQPISMETDDRGRLWVSECYTYAKQGFDDELRDRLLILEDTDGDGEHDLRKVFWDQGNRLTSILPGTKGCWILNHGTLAWLADENGDDIADGEPQIILDGFNFREVGHNIVGGMISGPDGWIYGRHGILGSSLVGKPGESASQRTPLNCGVWRFHPQQHHFEVLAHGTTNPWGLDYNDLGEIFFTNNVTGHGWHVFPNAHYKRMYGADFNPHYYELIDQHADHYHWDHSMKWTESRTGDGLHGELGGGHSHCGLMIYLGDNWPQQHRNNMFMCNTHGRRVNQDIPVRKGSGYSITHGQDFLFANQPWFRGVNMIYGPDGGVYLSDWTDLGECHDHDGVHRTSGRIYKITYGKPQPYSGKDLGTQSLNQLVKLQLHKNDWYVRHARRILVDKKVAGEDVFSAIKSLREMAKSNPDITRRLRAIWSLYAMEAFPQADQIDLLASDEEHLRVWGVRLLSNYPSISPKVAQAFVDAASKENSALVRLYLASAMVKIPGNERWLLASHLCSHSEDIDDHNLPLLIWYGIEPAVVEHPRQALKLMRSTQIPLVRKFLARRLMHENEQGSSITKRLVEILSNSERNEAFQLAVLQGMSDATKGWRNTPAPENWSTASEKLMTSSNKQIKELTQELSVVFGDGRAMDALRELVGNKEASVIERQNALEILTASQVEGILALLKSSLTDKVLEEVVVRGLAGFEDPEIPILLVRYYQRMDKGAREANLDTLCAHEKSAQYLLEALKNKNGNLPDVVLSATQARQIASFNNPELAKLLEEVWGTLGTTDAQKEKQIAEIKQRMSDAVLAAANLKQGRALFEKTCANCHRLYDAGKNIGPNITGSNRDNIDYLLVNIISPSTVVPNQYKISTIVLKSGQVINGTIITRTDKSLTVQTEKQLMNIDAQTIELINPSALSLMPNGLMDKFTDEQIRDLFGYLQSKQQVALPAE